MGGARESVGNEGREANIHTWFGGGHSSSKAVSVSTSNTGIPNTLALFFKEYWMIGRVSIVLYVSLLSLQYQRALTPKGRCPWVVLGVIGGWWGRNGRVMTEHNAGEKS